MILILTILLKNKILFITKGVLSAENYILFIPAEILNTKEVFTMEKKMVYMRLTTKNGQLEYKIKYEKKI